MTMMKATSALGVDPLVDHVMKLVIGGEPIFF
jgi:hypothetical protein